MGYVAVKGGTDAIRASTERLRYERLKHGVSLDVRQARAGLRGLVDQVMSEASLYDEPVAAHAIKQAEGSPEEAVFLLRAYRSTLPRLHTTVPIDGTSARVERRISAAFKDVPGGQILGAGYDYVHRLLDDTLMHEEETDVRAWLERWRDASRAQALPNDAGRLDGLPKVADYLRAQGLMEPRENDDTPPDDVTKRALRIPASRSERLQVLTRGQTGTVTSLGYASLRGYGPMLHPTVGELRVAALPLTIPNPLASHENEAVGGSDPTLHADPDDGYYLGEIRITEVETVVPVQEPGGEERQALRFDLGYGACFGQNETKAIAMSLLDQCLEHPDSRHPTHDEEFILMHVDSVEATGFISHLKLPHYVTFQSELDAVRRTHQPDAVSGEEDA